MRICDITLAYTETSGGIRTYLDQKRQFISSAGSDQHTLIVAGDKDAKEVDGALTKVSLKSPYIPGCKPYRIFSSPDKIVSVLEETEPDIIELGSFFISPWAAFRYRKHRLKAGKPCLISAYFHTDIADAYFAGPLEKALETELVKESDILSQIKESIAGAVENTAQAFFGYIFDQCDLVLAASEEQKDRLGSYGIDEVKIIPLGVDTRLFHPDKRNEDVRRRVFDADEDSLVCVYAGRLDDEKEVDVLVDALRHLKDEKVRLVLMGEGPKREKLESSANELKNLKILPYEKDKARFAELLASADIYVTAGPHETFGLSVVEAQASGLPVVGVEAGALVERVNSDIGRLAAPGDGAEMAKRLKEVIRNLSDMKRQARAYVMDQGYDWDSSFERLIECYRGQFRALADGGKK